LVYFPNTRKKKIKFLNPRTNEVFNPIFNRIDISFKIDVFYIFKKKKKGRKNQGKTRPNNRQEGQRECLTDKILPTSTRRHSRSLQRRHTDILSLSMPQTLFLKPFISSAPFNNWGFALSLSLCAI
jgi:hypothetical protein